MEKQEESVPAEKTGLVQGIIFMAKESFSIFWKTLLATRKVIYPDWLRKMSLIAQAVIIFLVLALVLGTAVYSWAKFMEYVLPILGSLFLIGLLWVIWFKTEIPTKIWELICMPFIAIRGFFFGSILRKVISCIAFIPLLVMIWVGRGVYQPYVSEVVAHLANIFVLINLIVLITFVVMKKRKLIILNILIFALLQFTGVVDVMSYNKRLNDLDVVDIVKKPETTLLYWEPPEVIDNQLIANTDNNELKSPSDLAILSDDELGYTVGITPRSGFTQLISPFSKGGYIGVSTNPATPNDISRELRLPIEKNLWFGRNSDKAIAKSFGFLEYFTSKIGNTIRLKDKNGDYYLVVQVDRLKGFPNAYYAPAGVYISKAGDDTPRWKFWLFGAGKHVSPEETKDYPFLIGQSLISERSLEQIGNSGKFIQGYYDAYIKREEGVIPDMLNGKLLHNIVHIDEELGGKHYKGLAAELQMVGFRNIRSLNRTWIIPLSGNRNTVYQYLNFQQKDFRSAPSILVPSILDGLPDRNMNKMDYRVADIHSVKLNIDDEIIEGYMTTVEKLASQIDENASEDERESSQGANQAKDLNVNKILVVLNAKSVPYVERHDPRKTVPEQVEKMYRDLFNK